MQTASSPCAARSASAAAAVATHTQSIAICRRMLGPQFSEALARLPDFLGGHVLVSLTALAIGLAVSLPTALVSLRRPWLRGGLLAAASVAQTVPGLALLALFYPLLLALSAVSQRLFGISFPAL